MMFARNASFGLTALLGLVMAAPALANAPQDTTAQPPAPGQPAAMDTGQHPPNPDGLTNVDAMILDCDDMLNIIDGMRGDTRAMLGTIDQANTTLTSIATLIDQINARHQQQTPSGDTPPATPPPGQTPPP
ncbi:MAG TPA: hypothetical protein VFA07_07050 [Chthonomonadaceae bacterium]|nr:hypothetical protein [Chthonomonadaceae bacterium]